MDLFNKPAPGPQIHRSEFDWAGFRPELPCILKLPGESDMQV